MPGKKSEVDGDGIQARKSKFQEELDKIAAQYGVSSKELQV